MIAFGRAHWCWWGTRWKRHDGKPGGDSDGDDDDDDEEGQEEYGGDDYGGDDDDDDDDGGGNGDGTDAVDRNLWPSSWW